VLPPARTVELPCCYGGDLGFELDAVAAKLDLAPEEMVRLHAGADYHVYFVGFTPGLPYMTGMPERINIPRLVNPRTKTPAGSVAIGGVQCCIYSVESPGGFWVLGRTPVRLYDPRAGDPILLRAGDHVRFRPIERAEYDAIAAEGGGGPLPAAGHGGAMRLGVLDAARSPPSRISVARDSSGWESPRRAPWTARAFVLANRLVGNLDGSAGLECTLLGPRLEFADRALGGGDGCRGSRDARRRRDAALGLICRARGRRPQDRRGADRGARLSRRLRRRGDAGRAGLPGDLSPRAGSAA
jgi:hypothetical protein